MELPAFVDKSTTPPVVTNIDPCSIGYCHKSAQSPLAPKKARLLFKQLCDNQKKQARKYSVNNLYQIRHCFREMPKNAIQIPNIFAPGLGMPCKLCISIKYYAFRLLYHVFVFVCCYVV